MFGMKRDKDLVEKLKGKSIKERWEIAKQVSKENEAQYHSSKVASDEMSATRETGGGVAVAERLIVEEEVRVEAPIRDKKYLKVLEKNRNRLHKMQVYDNGMSTEKRDILDYDTLLCVDFYNGNRGWIYCFDVDVDVIIGNILSNVQNKVVDFYFFNRYYNGSILHGHNLKMMVDFSSISTVYREVLNTEK